MRTIHNKFDYRRKLPHIQKDDRAHFITSCTDRRWVLPPACRDIVLESCLFHDDKEMQLHVAVVMPDHLHLICTMYRDEKTAKTISLQELMQSIKSYTAHQINKVLGRSGLVWEDESFDHVLRHEESLAQKIEYVKQNPVRAGLVDSPADYKWLWSEDMVDWVKS